MDKNSRNSSNKQDENNKEGYNGKGFVNSLNNTGQKTVNTLRKTGNTLRKTGNIIATRNLKLVLTQTP